ncbi:flagellar biosynthesis anti-sigma factor FlgM [Hydrogenophaga sp. 2FB]|uniref:flagellar biosynthesis anti-sigma factor FlgM n=1 Tax=Hydrogenophaga sp. 2FB TaxID=2502187 RepID=UPI0010FA5754|nr:flagellar biosynthesis anti-sigma factor FlgM [Hydrogenophaga sp. 2FB]
MKVDSSPDSYIGSVAGGPQKAADKPVAGVEPTATVKPQPAGVTVTLSPSTVSAMGPGGSSEVFNAEKVEAMKQAIANGTFQVNAEAIADKMLANAAEMLNGGRA